MNDKYSAESNRAWVRNRVNRAGLRREINLKAILRAPQEVIDAECERMIRRSGLIW